MRIILSVAATMLLLLLFAIAPAVAQEGPSEDEPNNTKAHATSIDGDVIEGEIGAHDDTDDWYVLEGQEGTNPSFTMTFDADTLEVDWEVISDDEVVASRTDYGSPDSVTCEVPGTCYIHVWHWSGEGEYRIEINSDACQGDDEVEPNNDKDLADSIDGLEIDGYACANDEDWYVLEGQEGRNPTFTMTFNDEDLEVDWEVYSDDEVVASMTDWDSPEDVTCRIPGTCYIRVWWWEGEGDYKIEIEP